MPLLTKKKLVSVPAGMQCDVCGMRDDERLNSFAIDHTLGYASPMDMSHITAAVCDACLLGIVVDKVPGAVITSNLGSVVSHESAATALIRYYRQTAAPRAGTSEVDRETRWDIEKRLLQVKTASSGAWRPATAEETIEYLAERLEALSPSSVNRPQPSESPSCP